MQRIEGRRKSRQAFLKPSNFIRVAFTKGLENFEANQKMMHQTSNMPPQASSGKTRNRVLWALQILTALVFLAAGIPKLMGVPAMVSAFAKIGFGQWFRYVTGTLETICAVGLLVPRFTFYAALLLAITMVCAIYFCLVILHQSPVAAIVCLLLTGTIAYFRRP